MKQFVKNAVYSVGEKLIAKLTAIQERTEIGVVMKQVKEACTQHGTTPTRLIPYLMRTSRFYDQAIDEWDISREKYETEIKYLKDTLMNQSVSFTEFKDHVKVENYWDKKDTSFTGSVIDKSKCITYYLNGKLHRVDGPAVEFTDGTKHWYYNDELICSYQDSALAHHDNSFEHICKALKIKGFCLCLKPLQ